MKTKQEQPEFIYFIEHNETHLWFYPKFGKHGERLETPYWTNNPDKALQFDEKEYAEDWIELAKIENAYVTEHEFVKGQGEPTIPERLFEKAIAGDFGSDMQSPTHKSLQEVKQIRLPTEFELFTHAEDAGLRDWEQQLWWEGATYVRNLALNQFQASNGWVSCKERLPEDGMLVACLDKHGRVSYNPWMPTTPQYKEWFKEIVTHWIPLPSPPLAD